jgi:hypothetical protein
LKAIELAVELAEADNDDGDGSDGGGNGGGAPQVTVAALFETLGLPTAIGGGVTGSAGGCAGGGNSNSSIGSYSKRELVKAYRKLAMTHHPDRWVGE